MGHTSSRNINILVFVGSLRRNSYNHGLVNTLLQSSQFKSSGINAIVPNLGQIPFFNQDYEDEKNIPKKVNELCTMCIKSNLLLFATPQYNSSVTPPLKNAFDWLTRPSSLFENKVPAFGKKAAVMSTSYVSQLQIQDAQKMGGYRKLIYHEKPYYINLGSNVFDRESGRLNDEAQKKRLIQWGGEVVKFALQQPKQAQK